ncbi:unnamed protein product [Sympodiomycopsis kandeliae]
MSNRCSHFVKLYFSAWLPKLSRTSCEVPVYSSNPTVRGRQGYWTIKCYIISHARTLSALCQNLASVWHSNTQHSKRIERSSASTRQCRYGSLETGRYTRPQGLYIVRGRIKRLEQQQQHHHQHQYQQRRWQAWMMGRGVAELASMGD